MYVDEIWWTMENKRKLNWEEKKTTTLVHTNANATANENEIILMA